MVSYVIANNGIEKNQKILQSYINEQYPGIWFGNSVAGWTTQ